MKIKIDHKTKAGAVILDNCLTLTAGQSPHLKRKLLRVHMKKMIH